MQAVAIAWVGSTAITVGAFAGVTTQTFVLNMYGGSVIDGGSLSRYTQETFGVSTGYFARTSNSTNFPSKTYNAYTGPAADLTEVSVNLRMHVDNVTTARKFATRLTISTGVTPNLYNQLDGITTNSTTNTSGDWTYNWRFTGAALAAWLSPATPTGTVLAEIMSGSSWSTGTMTVDISYTTVPAPAGLAIFALGGLARRRRAA